MANFYFDYSEGDWSDTTKWYLDTNLTIPANSLPTSSDDVYISSSGAYVILGSAVAVCNNLYLDNTYLSISVTVAGTAFFNGASSLIFYLDDYEFPIIVGNAEFYDLSTNDGTVTGDAHYYDFSSDTANANSVNLYLHSPKSRDITLLLGTYTTIIYSDYTIYLHNATWYLDSGLGEVSFNAPTLTDDVVVLAGDFDASGQSSEWIGMLGATANNLIVESGFLSGGVNIDNTIIAGNIVLNNASYVANDSSILIMRPTTFNDSSQNLGAYIVYPGSATFNDNSKNYGTIGSEVNPIGATINFPVKLPLGGTVYGAISYINYNPLSYNNNILSII